MKTSVVAKNATADYIINHINIAHQSWYVQNLHIPRNKTTFVLIIYVTKQPMTTNTPQLNDHNKAEFPPMHTAEHILNQTMVRRYGCPRSRNAHIERKKSKVSYELPTCPSDAEVQEIVDKVNEIIQSALPVTVEYVALENVPADVSLEKLPSDASDTIRLVRIGDYDVCACIGAHVANTSEIGTFTLLGTNWDEEKKSFRIRFKLV